MSRLCCGSWSSGKESRTLRRTPVLLLGVRLRWYLGCMCLRVGGGAWKQPSFQHGCLDYLNNEFFCSSLGRVLSRDDVRSRAGYRKVLGIERRRESPLAHQSDISSVLLVASLGCAHSQGSSRRQSCSRANLGRCVRLSRWNGQRPAKLLRR